MSGLNCEKCLIYFDDIIVFGDSIEQHNKNLMAILNRLRKVSLRLNPSKCNFLQKEIVYLGHLISAEGIKPDPSKVACIKEWPIPTTADEVS